MADSAPDVWTALIGAAGSLAMYIVKSWWDDKRAAKKQEALEKRAVDIVKSPDGTDDPMTAVQQASIEQNMGRLVDSARRVRESFAPPNVSTIPPLGATFTKVDAFPDDETTPKLKVDDSADGKTTEP